jgi:hypothetical protein
MRVRSVLPAAAVAAAIVAGCTTTTAGSGRELAPAPSGSSSPDFPSPPASTAAASSTAPTTTSSPSRAQLAARLASLVPGQRLVLVAIPGGYEAISYDQSAHIEFWKCTGADWTRVGTSSYPHSGTIGSPPDAKASGRLLTGMHDATFIVTGTFTGDSSGNAVAYTTGSRGWGAIKAEPNGNIGPSGQPVGKDGIGLSFGFAFAGGRLQTEDCPRNQPVAACGLDPVVKLWAWNGTDFARV